jgi:DNA-directed RNA polymerase specialized sigma24 family protein
MDDAALDRLPTTYAAALRLSQAGVDHAAIAAEMQVEPRAVGPLLAIAEAKLAALTAAPDAPTSRPASTEQVPT